MTKSAELYGTDSMGHDGGSRDSSQFQTKCRSMYPRFSQRFPGHVIVSPSKYLEEGVLAL